MGAEVIAVARGPEKLALAREKGAAHLIDAGDADIVGKLKALGGVDVFYDTVGGEMFTAGMKAANFEARLLPIGFAGGEVPQIPANHMLVKNISAIGFWIGAYLTKKPEPFVNSLRTLLDWRAEGRFKVEVPDIVAFERANDALDLLRSRKAMGKVVIRVG
jgi:NADPH2:quinone reductase